MPVKIRVASSIEFLVNCLRTKLSFAGGLSNLCVSCLQRTASWNSFRKVGHGLGTLCMGEQVGLHHLEWHLVQVLRKFTYKGMQELLELWWVLNLFYNLSVATLLADGADIELQK